MSGNPLPSGPAPYVPPSDGPVVTTPFVPGYRVTREIGPTSGPIARSRGLGRNIVGGYRAPGGGEIMEYPQLLEQVRHDALTR